jgi:hypothetical protein
MRGKNAFDIESIIYEGWRVLLDHSDLEVLQNLERKISVTISQKTKVIRPAVIKQFYRLMVNIVGTIHRNRSGAAGEHRRTGIV